MNCERCSNDEINASANPVKTWWRSRSILFNLAIVAGIIADVATDREILPPSIAPYAFAFVAIVNVALRSVTFSAIDGTKAGESEREAAAQREALAREAQALRDRLSQLNKSE